MFGFTFIRTAKLSALRTELDNERVAKEALEDCRHLLLRDIQTREEEIVGLTVELNEAKARIEKILAEHNVLVGLCMDPTSPEAQRAGQFSASAVDVSYDVLKPLPDHASDSIPDATGHSS